MKSRHLWMLGMLSVGLSGCGLFAGPPPQKVPSMVIPSPSPGTRQWMTSDASTHALVLTVIAGYQNHGFNLNGTQNGAMQISVPVHWHVTIRFINHSGLSNSLAVVANATSRRVVFPGASTQALTRGIVQGQTQVFSFQTTHVGNFRLASLVPGHEDSGMWAHFVVTRNPKPALKI